jgi:hypothetical protein
MYIVFTHLFNQYIMDKKKLNWIASLSFAAAAAMYVIGSNNGHLSELVDFCWVPVPLGVIALVVASKKDAD